MAPVVALLSGGADSVCLLDVLAAERGAEAVVALHVNYGLRPEADADEAFCRDVCERLGVRLVVHRAPGTPDGNVQDWARKVRYEQAGKLADKLGADAEIAAGHTASDQVETVLYRLAASPGRRALLGMREREGRLIRPLLGWSAAQTREHCRRRGLEWREDPSNASGAYARNRVRHGLLEAMKEVHPAAERNVLRTLELLRDEAAVLDRLVEDALTDEIAALRELPPALGRLVVQRLAGPEAPALAARFEDLLALDDRGTRTLDVGGGWRAVCEYGRLRFEVPAHGAQSPEDEALLPVPGESAWGGGVVSAELVQDAEPADGVLDAAAVTLPLVVRRWRPGDRIRPLGLGGTRTLQDLFTDRKVPREQRHRLPVVLSAGEVAWVPGVATSEAFKVTESTREQVRLAWRA